MSPVQQLSFFPSNIEYAPANPAQPQVLKPIRLSMIGGLARGEPTSRRTPADIADFLQRLSYDDAETRVKPPEIKTSADDDSRFFALRSRMMALAFWLVAPQYALTVIDQLGPPQGLAGVLPHFEIGKARSNSELATLFPRYSEVFAPWVEAVVEEQFTLFPEQVAFFLAIINHFLAELTPEFSSTGELQLVPGERVAESAQTLTTFAWQLSWFLSQCWARDYFTNKQVVIGPVLATTLTWDKTTKFSFSAMSEFQPKNPTQSNHDSRLRIQLLTGLDLVVLSSDQRIEAVIEFSHDLLPHDLDNVAEFIRWLKLLIVAGQANDYGSWYPSSPLPACLVSPKRPVASLALIASQIHYLFVDTYSGHQDTLDWPVELWGHNQNLLLWIAQVSALFPAAFKAIE